MVAKVIARAFAAAAMAVVTLAPSALPVLSQERPLILAPPQPLGTLRPVLIEPQKPAAGPGIKVETLGDIDPNSVGLLDAGAGGFGVAMWKGTPREMVESVLPTLPGAPRSAVARDLYRRLLLSAAAAPAGSQGMGRPSLVAMRVDRLLVQGDVASAQSLLRVVPERLDDEPLARMRAEVALLMNDNAGACAEVRRRIAQFTDDFWRKAQVFCQLLDGDKAGASIGAGLLQEQGADDTAFYALVRVLGGDKAVLAAGLDKPTPLHLAMLRAGSVPIPPVVANEGAPSILRMVAQSPNADLDTRLEAAEKAEMFGALDTEALRQLYLSVNFTPDELAGALSAAEKLSGPRGRALLFHAARGQTVAAARAEIVALALTLARKQDRAPLAIRVMAPILNVIEPSDDLAWFAAQAGGALYLVGAAEAAGKWMALAVSKAGATGAKPGNGTDKLPAAAALWPLAQLSSLPIAKAVEASAPPAPSSASSERAIAAPAPPSAPALDAIGFEAWWQAAAVLGDDLRARRAVRFLSLAEALGAQVEDVLWARLLTAPAPAGAVSAAPGLMAGLKRASAAARVGETVLLSLAALGTESPGRTDIRVLGSVVGALRGAGLEDPARRLAIETVFLDQI